MSEIPEEIIDINLDNFVTQMPIDVDISISTQSPIDIDLPFIVTEMPIDIDLDSFMITEMPIDIDSIIPTQNPIDIEYGDILDPSLGWSVFLFTYTNFDNNVLPSNLWRKEQFSEGYIAVGILNAPNDVSNPQVIQFLQESDIVRNLINSFTDDSPSFGPITS